MGQVVGWTEWLNLLNQQLARENCPEKGVRIRLTPESERPAGFQYERTPASDSAVSWALDQLRIQGVSTVGW